MADFVEETAPTDEAGAKTSVIQSTEEKFVRFVRDVGLGLSPVFLGIALATGEPGFLFLAALSALSGAMALLQVRLARVQASVLMIVVVTLAAAQTFTLDPAVLEALWVAIAALGAIGSSFVSSRRRWSYHTYVGLIWIAQPLFHRYDEKAFFMAVQLCVYLLIALGLRQTLRSLESTEHRYENLFLKTPIATFQEDFSEAAAWVVGLRLEGIEDLKAHLDDNPDLVRHAHGLISITAVNEATVELLGAASVGQLTGRLNPDHYRPETHDSVVAQLLGIWNRQESVATEMAGQTLQGEAIDCVLYWTAPRTRTGFDYSKVVVSLVDVSPLKASEREANIQLRLAKQERRLQIIASNATDLLFILGSDGKVSWISASVSRLLGYEIPEMIGRPFHEFVHAEDAAAIVGAGVALAYGETSDPVVHRVRHSDGSWRSFEATARNMVDDQFVEGYVISSRDITDRVVAEEALRDSEARFRLLAENSTDMISSHDPTGVYRYVSPASMTLLGRPPEEIVGLTPYDLAHPDDVAGMTAAHQSASEAGKDIVMVDYRMQHADGSWRWFGSNFKMIFEEGHEELIRLHASTRNISERKEAEEALVEAKVSAERATETKSQFLANVSHEIRTPMNAILGMTELALGTEVTAEQREYLVTTRSSADALITLVNDLLDIAKIEAGKLEFEAIPFELRDTLSDTLRTLGVKASEKGIGLSQDVAANVPAVVVGDPGRMRQILFNLVGNALKFTHEGNVSIGVDVVDETEAAVDLHIWVKDTGIGIPPEGLEFVFEAFSQAEGSTARRFGGTGLGLSISTQLVKMMQGKLWVDSEVGVGSTFHFTARLAPASRESEVESDGTGSATTVLVIADSEEARRGTTEMLRLGGLRSIVANDLAGALDIVFEAGHAHPKPGAVVIDVRAGTAELASRLVKEPTFKDLPIVVLTPTGERGDAAVYRAAGAAGYLSKPLGAGELSDTISAVSGRNRPEGELVTRHWLRARRPRMNLLVADDSATNRTMVTRLLEKRGHTVTVVENGRDAVELVLAIKFDAVLMDVQMPEMDGLEATSTIRAQETGHIPIIGLTGRASEEDRRMCLDSGMDNVVSKPFRPETLFAAVEQVFTGLVDIDSIPKRQGRPVDLLDRFEALERLGGMPDLAVELMQEFQKEYPADLELIREGFAARDFQQVSRVAHRMKGSLGLLSAGPAAQAAALLERHAADGTVAHAETAWKLLQEEMESLEPVIVRLAESAGAWA